MITIDEAIAKRLEEKRLAREEAARKEEERQEAIAKSEREIAEQARRILSDCLEIDFPEEALSAAFSHEIDNGCYWYKIRLQLPGDSYVTTDSNLPARDFVLDPENLLSATWRSIHVFNTGNKDCRTTTDTDLLEMIIFAMHGSTSDYLSAMASAEEPGW